MNKKTIILFAALAIGIFNSHSANADKGGVPTGWSMGLRLGDPLGLTFKKHFGGNKAFEFNVGRTNVSGFGRDYRSGYYNNWYNERYYDNGKYKGPAGYFGYNNYSFRAFSFQAHYIIHKDIKPVPGLRWYFGFGPQVQIVNFTYRYYNDDRQFFVDDSQTFVNLGLDGTGGIEYSFSGVPLTVFADVTLYMEVYREPFIFRPQGGIGARYNF